MGNHIICQHCISRRSVSPQESKKIRILLVGLDNAGKTTAAKGLIGEPVASPAPTLGFSRLELRRRGWTVELYDVGGGRGIRGIWRNYLAESHGLVFVVDASDAARTEECRETLHGLLGDPRVRGKPVLILANKQDEPSALDEVELNERLQLEAAANQHRCPMRIELCSARLSALSAGKKRHLGVQTGFNWLADYVIDNNSSLEERVAADLAVRAVELDQQRWARDERVRRNREAAAAAAAAAAAGDDQAGGDPVETIQVAPAADEATPTRRAGGTAPASADIKTPRPYPSRPMSPIPPTPFSPEAPPTPPSEAPSPDTPLQPELEAQIQEVFTRTEMGRLVRAEVGRGGVEGAVVEGTVERQPEGPVEQAGAGGGGRAVGDDGDTGGAANGNIVEAELNGGAESDGSGGGGGGSGVGGIGGSTGGVNGRAGGGGETVDGQPVVVHSAAIDGRQSSREQSPDPPVMENDSGQGSIKESDSETLMSSNASRMSTQVNGIGPTKRRNRFFKRYTKTAPMPDDVLLTSLPSTPPTRTE